MSSKRKKAGDDKVVAIAFGIALAIGAFVWLLHELELHWWIGILLAAAALAVTVVCIRIDMAKRAATAARAAALRVDILAIDAASPKALEHTVAALLERDGWSATVTGRALDQGVDVLGSDGAGHVVAVQCKHTRVGKRYGTPALYPVSGNRGVYKAQLAALVTNGGITGPGRQWAADPTHRVHLVDRDLLARWGAGQVPAATLFGIAGHIPHPRSAGGIAAAARRPPVGADTIHMG